MKAEANTTRSITVVGCLYFGLVPFVPIRTIIIGPFNLLVWLATATIAALLIVPSRTRVWHTPGWSIASAFLWSSWGIGLMRAPAFATQSAVLWSSRFAVPWLLISLCPLDRRYLRLLCISWFTGLCVTAAWQYVSIDNSGIIVTANSQYSYSRLLQNSEEWGATSWLGVYDTYGCMAMSVAAACALALALTSQKIQEQVLLGIGSLLLIYTEWCGRFIVSDLMVFLGIIMALGLAAIETKMKFRHVLLIIAVIIIVTYISVKTADTNNNITWQRIISIIHNGSEGDISTSTRLSLISISISSWLSNPIFGIGVVGWTDETGLYIGGHSSLVDIPAQIGILGFIGYYGLMLFPLKRAFACFISNDYSRDDRKAAMLVIIGLALVFAGSCLNPTYMMALISETLLLLVALGATLPKILPRRIGNPPQGGIGRRTGEPLTRVLIN